MQLQQPHDQLISKSPRFEKYLHTTILLCLFGTCLLLPWTEGSLVQAMLVICVNLLTATLMYFFVFSQADRVTASPNTIEVQKGKLKDSISLENVISARIQNGFSGAKYVVIKLRVKSALGYRVIFGLPYDYSKSKWSETQVTQRLQFLSDQRNV
jgi:hypothetical protein